MLLAQKGNKLVTFCPGNRAQVPRALTFGDEEHFNKNDSKDAPRETYI